MASPKNKYTAVEMEEKKSEQNHEVHDLEEPFNEEFWLQVRIVRNVAVCFYWYVPLLCLCLN